MNNIETLKLALEALEYLDVTAENYVDDRIPYAAITALRQAIEQAQQAEPVAWRAKNFYENQEGWFYVDWHPDGLIPQVAELLYTSPPPRQPLTDEEMKAIWYAMQNIMGWYSFQEIARAIEAKLKEKNNV